MEKSVVSDFDDLDSLFDHYLFDIEETKRHSDDYTKQGMAIKRYRMDNGLYMYTCSQSSDTNNQFPKMEILSTDPVDDFEPQESEDDLATTKNSQFYIQRVLYPSGNRECIIFMSNMDSIGYIKYSNDPNIALSYSLPSFDYDELFEGADQNHLNNPLRILKYAATHPKDNGYDQAMYMNAYHSLSNINNIALNEIKEFLYQRAYMKLSNRPNLLKMRFMLDLNPEELEGILQASESMASFNREKLSEKKLSLIKKIIDSMKTNERLEELIKKTEEELARNENDNSKKDRD